MDVPSLKPTLESFRRFARGHIKDFLAARDRLADLVDGRQPYPVGDAREDLLRGFVRRLLPGGLSVDSGIVYGFEQVENSAQIDVLVWNSVHYSPVYRTAGFVVLPPEAVVAAVSVKTTSHRPDIRDSVKNLQSLGQLDRKFRAKFGRPPIAKFLFAYESSASEETILTNLVAALRESLLEQVSLEDVLQRLRGLDPGQPAPEDADFFERTLPRLVVHLGQPQQSWVRGWGPPDITLEDAAAEEFKRIPYLYPQATAYTQPIEKLGYHLLALAGKEMGAPTYSLTAAWGDFHPVQQYKVGDAGELLEAKGQSLVSEANLTGASS